MNNRHRQQDKRCTRVNRLLAGRARTENHKWLSLRLRRVLATNRWPNSVSSALLASGTRRSTCKKKNMKWYYSVRKNSEPVTVHLVKSLKVLNRSVLSIQKLGRVWRSRSFSRQKHVFIRRRDLCPQGVFVFKSKLNRVLLGQSKLVAPEEGLVSERKHQANIFNSLFVIWF